MDPLTSDCLHTNNTINTNTTTDDNDVKHNDNDYPFTFETFDFVDKCCGQSGSATHGWPSETGITCFDVNPNFFVLGATNGLIHCFRRHVYNARQHKTYRFISSPVTIIKLITDQLWSFATQTAVYVLNRVSHQFLYGWKCPTKATITCLQTFLSISDHKVLIISGDSDGNVRYHDLINGRQSIIFKDTGFSVVQMEFVDHKTIVISTTLRSVVVSIDFCDINQTIVKQIGKNQRKTYGKFGAVFSRQSNTIYGSRPSLHLIKAQVSGDVIETIKVNYIQSSKCPKLVPEFDPNGDQSPHRLGVLKMFCDDQYVLSINDSNLVIIKTDGQFCLKERVDKLIDIKIATDDTNEAFILLESRFILRIRNRFHEFKQKYSIDFDGNSDGSFDGQTSFESDSGRPFGGDRLSRKGSTESLVSLIRFPANGVPNGNPLSVIDEELRKVFDFTKLQMKLTEKVNKLSASIITTIDPNVLPNSDKNVFIDPEDNYKDISDTNSPTREMPDFTSPLVIQRKPKRKTQDNSSGDSLGNSTSDKDVINDCNDYSPTKSTEYSDSLANDLQTNIDLSDKSYDELDATADQLTDENRLQMILSAYKEANPHLDTISANIITEPLEEDNNISQLTDNCIKLDDYNDDKEVKEIQDMISQFELDEQLAKRVDEELNKNEITLRLIEQKWEPIICLTNVNQSKSIDFLSVCATGYNSSQDIGLIWFVPKAHNSLVYYPSLETLKLNKVQALHIASAANQLYVLTESGVILRREGMDATKPVGTKWDLIESFNKSKSNKNKSKIVSISLNTKESILWCCDTNGETWTHTIRSKQWSQINDYSSHSMEMRKVCVSVIDSTIVWGIDRNGKIFVRIFNTSCDNHKKQDFRGDQWLLVDGVLAKDIALFDNYVIIVVQNNQLFRRDAKYSQTSIDNNNEWTQVFSPQIAVDDTIISVSVTENNDLWLLTENGLVWHTINHPNRQLSVKEESDWLII